jgi:uncharacterized protein DUF4124
MSPRILALVVLLVARPLCAETYKWVDEKGVTNYSSSPPANAKLTKKTQLVEERLSVYTPDPALLRAIQVRPQASAPISYAPAPAYAPHQYVAAMQAMYDDCLAQRRVDCDGGSYYPYEGYFPYMPVFVVAGHVRRTPEAREFHARRFGMAPSSHPAPSARMMRTSSSWSR